MNPGEARRPLSSRLRDRSPAPARTAPPFRQRDRPGRRSPRMVGISSGTVGWMCAVRCRTVHGIHVELRPSMLCTASSPAAPMVAGLRLRCVPSSASRRHACGRPRSTPAAAAHAKPGGCSRTPGGSAPCASFAPGAAPDPPTHPAPATKNALRSLSRRRSQTGCSERLQKPAAARCPSEVLLRKAVRGLNREGRVGIHTRPRSGFVGPAYGAQRPAQRKGTISATARSKSPLSQAPADIDSSRPVRSSV